MSRKDSLKEKIAFLKVWLVSCIAVGISISSWIIKNLSLNFLFFVALISLSFIVFVIYKLSFKIFEYIKELERIE